MPGRVLESLFLSVADVLVAPDVQVPRNLDVLAEAERALLDALAEADVLVRRALPDVLAEAERALPRSPDAPAEADAPDPRSPDVADVPARLL